MKVVTYLMTIKIGFVNCMDSTLK